MSDLESYRYEALDIISLATIAKQPSVGGCTRFDPNVQN